MDVTTKPTAEPSEVAAPPQWAKITYDNMLRAGVFPAKDMKQKKGEDAKAYRERIERMVGARWGCSGSSVRSFRGLRRRPRLDKHPQFFADLAKYGAARFNAKGELIESSLGKGPTPPEFFAVTAAGSDGPRD